MGGVGARAERTEADLATLLGPVSEAMGATVSGFVKEKPDQPGSGIRHHGMPNPSRALGEYPARLSGNFVDSIGHEAVDALHRGWRKP
ncbi:hypothetical protein GCM10008949_38260 [Deinococcus humi]|nr:hypothetical protein GCM10008949_38260 [Deinococcus humi]